MHADRRRGFQVVETQLPSPSTVFFLCAISLSRSIFTLSADSQALLVDECSTQ